MILNETVHEEKRLIQTACCVCGDMATTAVGKLLVCDRELKNTVGTYTVALKTDNLSETKQKTVTLL